MNYKVDCQLIGIAGKAGSGKGSVQDYICNIYTNCYPLNFADALKYTCAELFGLHPQQFYGTPDKEIIDPIWNVSPRQIAQFVGTELIRDNIKVLIPEVDEDFWIKRLVGAVNGTLNPPGDTRPYLNDPNETVVIGDVRFQNEYDFIISNRGIVLKLEREGTKEVGFPGHRSELGFQLTPKEKESVYTINNNDTLDRLFNLVYSHLSNSHLKLSIIS